jgi:hypothetical protein
MSNLSDNDLIAARELYLSMQHCVGLYFVKLLNDELEKRQANHERPHEAYCAICGEVAEQLKLELKEENSNA